jgi:hypothetical protein
MRGIDGNGTNHPLSLIEGATENGRLTAEIGAIEGPPGWLPALLEWCAFNARERRTF